MEIHAFCKIYVKLIKSKVTPVKSISLPLLELCVAVLLLYIVEGILQSLTIFAYSLYEWCGSTIVLCWLQTSPGHWKTFVAKRVSKILQTVGCDKWYLILSQDKPADIGTRALIQNIYPKIAYGGMGQHGSSS